MVPVAAAAAEAPVVAEGASSALAAMAKQAPKIIDRAKRYVPEAYRRAKDWAGRNGVDLPTLTRQIASGDTRIGAAVIEAMVNPNKQAGDQLDLIRNISSAVPTMSEAQIRAVVAQIVAIKNQAASNAAKHHEALGGDPTVKMAETIRSVRRVCSILGIDEDRLMELQVFFANFGPEDILAAKSFRSAAGMR